MPQSLPLINSRNVYSYGVHIISRCVLWYFLSLIVFEVHAYCCHNQSTLGHQTTHTYIIFCFSINTVYTRAVTAQSVQRCATCWTIGLLGFHSLHHRIQNGSGVHPASYPMGNRGSFRGGKGPGREADHSPPPSAEVKECVELYLHSPNTPSWRGAQFKKRHGQLYFYGRRWNMPTNWVSDLYAT
jgi:hypothetical protein